jgi:hypothetical protein
MGKVKFLVEKLKLKTWLLHLENLFFFQPETQLIFFNPKIHFFKLEAIFFYLKTLVYYMQHTINIFYYI